MPDRSPAAAAARVAAAAAVLLLLAGLPAPRARSEPGLPTAMPAATGSAFTDSAGRRVVLPASIDRVLPAGRNAGVLVYVLAPDKLVGVERTSGEPALDGVFRATPAAMAEAARLAGAELIIDAGPVTPERAAFADRVQRLSGIPYVLVDDSFARMPQMLRAIGAILGVEQRADDLSRYADHAISRLRGRMLIAPADNRPRVYLALGPDGLTTALPGSPADAALEEVGVINVAAALGHGREAAVSPGQLIAWNPEVIIVERRSAYDDLRRDPQWRALSAARDGRVYLQPTNPFGWIEDPSGVNRLIGLNWLSALFYPAGTQKDMQSDVCNFYDKFYRIKLTNAEVAALVREAGVPADEAQEPLIGLGAAPLPPPAAPAPVARGRAAPAASSAAMSPSALTGVPGLPNMSPSAICAIPTAPTPLPLPGLAPLPDVPTAPAAPPGAENNP
jgi:iron complex transport system substrate-binding protein